MILSVRNCVLRASRCKRALNGSYCIRCFGITSSICYLFCAGSNEYIPDYSNMVGELLAYVQSLGLKAKRVISCSMIVQLSDHLKRVVFLWSIMEMRNMKENLSKLTKIQKGMIVFSVLYEIYIFIQCSEYYPTVDGGFFDWNAEEIFMYSLPIALYWTLFWVWGDKWNNFIKKKTKNTENIMVLLKAFVNSIMNFVGKIILILFVCFVGYTVFFNFIENSKKESMIHIVEKWQQMKPEVMEDIIKDGTSVKMRDENGNTLLMYAAEFNQDPKVIEVLIKNGADVNARNQEGMTALMYAVSDNNNSEIVRTLIKYGAEVNARHPNGDSVLIGASKLCQNPKVIEVLLKNGANIKLKNKNGTNALMGAALFNKNPDIIDVLIKYGADIKGRDDYGFTVLMLAAGKNENPEVIKRLIKYGAPISVDLNGRTVLDYAKLNSKIYGTDVYWLLNDLMYK